MSVKQLEVIILAYLKKAKKAGLADIIANCLEGTKYTFPEMRQALEILREKKKKINWSIKENKYLYREVKNVATDKRKTVKPKSTK